MAYYKMQEVPDLRKDGTQTTRPRLAGGQVITLDRLAGQVAQGTTFTPGEVVGLVGTLCRHIAWELGNGNRVKIAGLGTFSASLGLAGDAEPETPDGTTRRNARSIRARGVNYKADKQLVRDTDRHLRLERSPEKPRRSSTRYTPAERLALARTWLDTQPVLTAAQYATLTGLCATPAREELRRWAADPSSGIGTTGRGTHRVYVRRQA